MPRVLLVEDDPAVRRFVQLALDPLGVELVLCATLADARAALEAAAAQLVLTDLTLPDGSGLDLLAWMQARAPQAAACRTVVFSGGATHAIHPRLQALQVWRVLDKPASVGALMACVSEALDSLADTLTSVPAGALGAALAADPVAEFFGGDHALYAAYRQACMGQFPKDLGDGDLAAAAGDAQALRRVAHNLKSVLTMLGESEAARWARSTEDCAASGAREPMQQGWHRLREHLQRLAPPNAPL